MLMQHHNDYLSSLENFFFCAENKRVSKIISTMHTESLTTLSLLASNQIVLSGDTVVTAVRGIYSRIIKTTFFSVVFLLILYCRCPAVLAEELK